MIIIGEKLNSSIPSVKKLMDGNDLEGLKNLILSQRDAGADYIDVNTALCGNELEMMQTLCSMVLENSSCGIMLDSPNTEVCTAALSFIRGLDANRKIIINSVTVNERHQCIGAAKEFGAGIVVLLTDESGIPDSGEKRAENAKIMIDRLVGEGFDQDDIYIDVIAESVAVNGDAARNALDALCAIRKDYPDVHILCGLSNISFGLPKRSVVNNAFLTLAVYHGMDSVICDPLSGELKKAYLAAEVLNGNDDFCMEYIDEFRA